MRTFHGQLVTMTSPLNFTGRPTLTCLMVIFNILRLLAEKLKYWDAVNCRWQVRISLKCGRSWIPFFCCFTLTRQHKKNTEVEKIGRERIGQVPGSIYIIDQVINPMGSQNKRENVLLS